MATNKSCFNPFPPPNQIQLEVKVWFVQDQLKGSDTTEIRIKFVKKLEDAIPAGED